MKTNSVLGVHHISNLEELRSLAEALAQEVTVGDSILLSGSLGAGKTTFTQFLGKALGVQAKITSPTYTLIGEYPVVGHSEILTLIHMDLYRMGQSEKVLPLSNEYIQDVISSASRNRAVVVIEWAERLEGSASFDSWDISMKPGATPDSRVVTIS